MRDSRGQPCSRRRFLGRVMGAATAGLVGPPPGRVAAEPPPETTTVKLTQFAPAAGPADDGAIHTGARPPRDRRARVTFRTIPVRLHAGLRRIDRWIALRQLGGGGVTDHVGGAGTSARGRVGRGRTRESARWADWQTWPLERGARRSHTP